MSTINESIQNVCKSYKYKNSQNIYIYIYISLCYIFYVNTSSHLNPQYYFPTETKAGLRKLQFLLDKLKREILNRS